MRITGAIDPSTQKNVPKVFARDKKDAKVIPLSLAPGRHNSQNTDRYPLPPPSLPPLPSASSQNLLVVSC